MAEAQTTQVIATIFFIDGGLLASEDFTFETEQKFRRWAKEELKWESTNRIICKALNYDEKGSYAAFH